MSGIEMTGKELIKRIITHKNPPRIGFDFTDDSPSDFLHCSAAALVNPVFDRFGDWGRDEAVLKLVPNFSGDVFFVHSCGLVYDIIDDFIDAGVDVLQFDQPELSGSEVLANEFGVSSEARQAARDVFVANAKLTKE